jgi:polysaccharide export outer membrane protein
MKSVLPAILLLLYVIFTGCTNTKKVIYFNNIQDTSFKARPADLEPVIRKGDILSITVSSANPEASVPFNTPNVSSSSVRATQPGTLPDGYLVQQDGTIQFPVLGNLMAAGITKKALKDNIQNQLDQRKLLIDPIVSIRYLNFRVTVLGEVARPAIVNVPSEQITLFEALGLAGDLTIYAKRDNVLLIREEEGIKIIKRLNLNTSEILNSPYYYLKSNDIVYVEPGKSKVASASQSRQLVPIILSVLSFLVVVIDRTL